MMKSNKSSDITISWDDNKITLTDVFVGGKDKQGDAIAFYGGKTDLGEMGLSLMYLLRAVVKITRSEHHLSFRTVEDFVIHCLAEAIEREEEETLRERKIKKEEEMINIVKRFKENQK